MKDKKLNEKFGEYFEAIETPDNITADAKKYVKPAKPFMPRFLKFAAVAASVIIVCVVSVLSLSNLPSLAPGDNSMGDAPSTEAPAPDLYDTAGLETKIFSAYGIKDEHPSLGVLYALDSKQNASVNSCTAYYSDNSLMLVKSDVSLIDNLTRYDAEVYIELTDKTYSPLSPYINGEKRSYKGYTYYLTETVAQNGEPEYKLLITAGGVKYYVDVVSSDVNAYIKILKLFFG